MISPGYVILAQNDDYVLLGDDHGAIQAVTQDIACTMVELSILPTGRTLFTERTAVCFPAPVGFGRWRTVYAELKPFIDPVSRLSGEFAFAPNVGYDRDTGEPYGVWVVKRPRELFVYHPA